MQNKVREINNEKRFLREKPSKLFSFSPKRKQATRTHKKKTSYSMRTKCPFVRLCFDPRTCRTTKREREEKRGTRNSLHEEEEEEEEEKEIYQFKHIPTTHNHGEGRHPLQINRPDTTKTHTITKNWRGKSKPTRDDGSERKGCRWV